MLNTKVKHIMIGATSVIQEIKQNNEVESYLE